jgi:parallel beta-helix repeat protein
MLIADNLVSSGKAYGISVKLAATTDSCSSVIIRDNQVLNFATSATPGPGVDGQGIIVYGATGTLLANYKNITNVTITGNVCTGNAAHGIDLIAVSDYTITGNVCSGSVLNTDFGSGICVSEACVNGSVSGNTCTGNYDAGILLDVVDQTAAGNRFNYGYMSVTGNSCNTNTRAGIKVNSMPHTTISGNNCSGSFYGIFLAKGGFNNIVANTISSCSQNGIRLSGVAGATGDDQTNIVISDNIIDGIVASANDQFSALFIDYFATVRVQNNIFKGNTQDLTVQSTCSGVSLIENKFTSNLYIDTSASIIRWVDEFRTTASGKVFLSNEVSGDAMPYFRVDAAFTIPHFGLDWVPILSITPVTSSLTTAIATGGFIGQRLRMLNVNTNAITIKHNANTKNIGSVDVVLAFGEIVEYLWRGTQWVQTVAKVATSI